MRALLIVAAIGWASEAGAEALIVSLSSQRVAITSNYTGAQVVAFGSVERDAQTAPRTASYDIVVTVRGPRQAITVRERQALGPLWVNRAQQKFPEAPAFLGVYTTRPVEAIAGEGFRRRFGIGLRAIVGAPGFTLDRGPADAPFRAALLRIKEGESLYVERPGAATLLTPSLFRAAISLPATAPPGNYDVEVGLFADGVSLGRQTTGFELVKSGFEQRAADFAREHGTFYGLALAAMSLLIGWFASVIFRRD